MVICLDITRDMSSFAISFDHNIMDLCTSNTHTKSPDLTHLHLLLSKLYVQLPYMRQTSRPSYAHPNNWAKSHATKGKRTTQSPHTQVSESRTKAGMRWQDS